VAPLLLRLRRSALQGEVGVLWLHRIEGALARPPQHSEKNFSRDGLGTKWGTETPQRRGFKPKLPTPQMLEGLSRLEEVVRNRP
jgi:hypothetical protein